MLNPGDREIYLKELRPPVGYKLDRAIGTTFSLDLLSLLMAPLSLAFFEADNKEDILKNPIAVQEAIRRTADRLAIFCQQGRIKVPRKDTRLFSYLEPVVYDVNPFNDNGVFHPKIWVLRFISESEPVCYRLLCFSRNLTFDNSWDTVLRLEGNLEDEREYAFSRNYPLSDFIKTLPDISTCSVEEQVNEHINLLAEEILKVRFTPPDYFEEVEFIPSGIDGYEEIPVFNDYSRRMVISPFLSKNILKNLFNGGSKNILIAKGESLDQLESDFLKELENNTDIYILDEAAERPEAKDNEENPETDVDTTDRDLSGLHTKLYITEKGRDADLITGSANSTRAAFSGTNIEFNIRLKGKKSKIGIDPLLGKDDEQTTLRDLLKPYHICEQKNEDDKIRNKLEKRLDKARHKLTKCRLNVSIVDNHDNTYSLFIEPAQELKGKNLNLKGSCYPISLEQKYNKDISPLFNGNPVIFPRMSVIGLTGFIAFSLTVSMDEEELQNSFVLNLPVENMPEARDKELLQHIINNSDRFIRYLLFLLADEEDLSMDLLDLHKNPGRGKKNREIINLPLLEELIRAFSRDPGKISNIKKLVDELEQTEEGKEIFPEGFEKIWQPILEAGAWRETKNGE